MWNFLLDIIFPRQCFGCGKWGKYICDDCVQTKIEYFADQVCPYCEKLSLYGYTHPRCIKSWGIDGMFVLAHYHCLIPKIIHEIKYQSVYAASDETARLIAQKYHFQYKFQYFVPVPLSRRRENDRGFNQAEKLAKALSKCLPVYQSSGLPIKTINLLERVRETKPQFDLKYEERKTNLKDAFTLSSNLLTRSLANHSFCLVDDVATTGSTLFECAKVLKKAGAEKVWAICLARGG